LQAQIGFHQAIYEVVASFLRNQSVCAALMCFYAIAAKYIAQLAAAHTQDDKIDTTWFNVGMYICFQAQIGPHQAIYEVVASFLRNQAVCAALLCFYAIATKCIAQLAAAHTQNDIDRVDLVQCVSAICIPKLDLIRPSPLLRGCSIVSI